MAVSQSPETDTPPRRNEIGWERRLLLLPVPRYILCLPQHAQRVPAQDLDDRLTVVATVEQLLRDVWIARHVFELARHRAHAVEVRAEADVIAAGDLDDVLDVIDDVVDAAARDRVG